MKDRTNDAAIRGALKARLERRHGSEADVVIVEELPSRRASGRLDLAVLNGHLHGIEIKSDVDRLSRLPSQVAAFSPAMEQMTLVVAERHLAAAAAVVPDWWGVTAASMNSGGVTFRTERRGRRNGRVDPQAVAELLERNELLTILRRLGLDRGARTSGYDDLVARAVSAIGAKVLLAAAREALKFRAAWEQSEDVTAFGRSVVMLNPAPRAVMPASAASCAGSS